MYAIIHKIFINKKVSALYRIKVFTYSLYNSNNYFICVDDIFHFVLKSMVNENCHTFLSRISRTAVIGLFLLTSPITSDFVYAFTNCCRCYAQCYIKTHLLLQSSVSVLYDITYGLCSFSQHRRHSECPTNHEQEEEATNRRCS